MGYLQAAAAQALGRSAPREAIQHLKALLEALPRLPEGPERDQAELAAQLSLGPALIATCGFASPEVEAAFTRAHDCCVALDRPRELRLVLHGLAAVAEFRGRYHRSEALLTRVLGLGVGELAVEAHELLACSTFHQGAAARAVGYAERGLALFDEGGDHTVDPTYLAPYGEHPAVCCHYWAALALWFLGRPDSALAHGEQARALAAAHPYSLASAEVQLAYLHQYRGEPSETLRWAGRALGTATEHGFPIRVSPGGHPRRLGPGRDRDRRQRCRPAPGRAGRVPGHRRRARPPLLPRAARRGRGRDHRRAGGGAGRRRRGDRAGRDRAAVLLPARAPPPPWRPAGPG